MTVENIQQQMAKVTAPERARLQELMHMRRFLYAAYVVTQQGDYVYRPSRKADKVGISVIHLPTGRTSYTDLEGVPPSFLGGIFCLLDYDQGTVYHPAFFMQPKKDHYLVAQPISIPK